MKHQFISTKAVAQPVSDKFSNIILIRLFGTIQQWRRWVGWCSSVQGSIKQTGGCLVLLAFIFSFSACENENNKLKPPAIPSAVPSTCDNPFLGTWYEFGSADTQYTKVVFNETTLTALYYGDNVKIGDYIVSWDEVFYDNIEYSYDDNILTLYTKNPHTGYPFVLETNFNFLSKDTLIIEQFLPSETTQEPPIFKIIELYRSAVYEEY